MPLLAPYFVAFKTEHADRDLMRQSAEALLADEMNRHKVAIFSDLNPTSILDREEIDDILENEITRGYDTVYFTLSREDSHIDDFYTYEPIAHISRDSSYSLPPLLRVAHDFSEECCDTIYIDTLGPMGLLGLFLGKLLKIPVISTYHKAKVAALTQKNAGQNSTYFKGILSFLYHHFDQVRLLDSPTPFEYDILKRSKTNVYILSDKLVFEEPELPILPVLGVLSGT